MNDLQDDLLKKIKTGEIDMKPKWHFVLETGLLFVGAVIATLLVIYFVSFVFFFLQQSGVLFAPGFGLRGLSFFVLSSPWILIGASLAFLLLLYFLVTRYSFSYRQPLLYTMFGVILLALLGSWFVQQALVHERVGAFMERHEVPMLASFYRGALQEQPEGLVVGTVTEITETGFEIDSDHHGVLSVITTDKTRMRRGMSPEVGDRVMVFGDVEEDVVTAFGVRPYTGGKGAASRHPLNQEGQSIRPAMDRMERGSGGSMGER